MEHVHAGRRRDHEDERDGDGGERAEGGEVPPGGPGDEQHGEGDDDVDEGRAEVRLQHHERRRDEREQHDARGRPAVGEPARRSTMKADSDTIEQHLAELRGLEREEGKLDRAARAARDVAERQHGEDRADQQAVDADLELAEPRVVERATAMMASAPPTAKYTAWRVTK